MTFATLDSRNRVRGRLQDLGMSAIALAKLSGIPASRINLGLRNLADWSPADQNCLLDLTIRLQEIRDAFAPLPLSMGDPEQLRNLLDHVDRNNITPADIRELVQTIFKGK
jgi:hypothetical protein